MPSDQHVSRTVRYPSRNGAVSEKFVLSSVRLLSMASREPMAALSVVNDGQESANYGHSAAPRGRTFERRLHPDNGPSRVDDVSRVVGRCVCAVRYENSSTRS